MTTGRAPIRCLCNVLLAAVPTCLVVAAIQGAPPEDKTDTLLPGAKLVRKFKTEVYRLPVLLDTKDGTRLLMWVDPIDPTAPSRFPGEPMKDPVFDLFAWDVKGDKEVL